MGTVEDIAVLQSQMETVLERLDLAEPVVAQNATDIAVLQTDFSPVPGQVIILTTRMDNIESDVISNATGVADNATAIASNDADISALDTRVSVNETKLESFEPRLLQVEATETDHENRVTINEGILADLQPRMTTAETTITDHGTRLSDAESTVGQNVIDIDANQTALIAAGTTIVEHGSELNALDTRLTANEAVDAAQQTVIDQSAIDITTIQENGITRQELIDEISVQLEALDLDVDALQAAQQLSDYILERFDYAAKRYEQVLTSATSVFNLNQVGSKVDVYVDDVLVPATEYVQNRGTFTFNSPVSKGQKVRFMAWGI